MVRPGRAGLETLAASRSLLSVCLNAENFCHRSKKEIEMLAFGIYLVLVSGIAAKNYGDQIVTGKCAYAISKSIDYVRKIKDKNFDFSSLDKIKGYDFLCAKKNDIYWVSFSNRATNTDSFFAFGVELDLKTLEVRRFQGPPKRGRPYLGE